MTIASATPRMPMLVDYESENSFQSTISTNNVNGNNKRSIRFKGNVEVIEVLHANDFSDDEYHDYWLSAHEYRIISEMVDITVGLMNLGGEEDSDIICFRGLEGKTTESRVLYAHKYHELVQSVLNEQDRQRRRRRRGSSKLAKVSAHLSGDCRKTANKLGEQDALEARQCTIR
mmetsp:Transcript_123091/g.184099  ORF Transcript_123091/g.184099 Transcript_123091/m.184099 type:complete len:174 (+) Transcript_123091:169-690(+)